MIYEAFRDICIEILTLNESKEKLVHNLNVRPRDLEHRLIFLGVESLALWIHRRRYGPKEILAEHIHYSWVHWFRDDLAVVCDVIK